jgi:hypothetical protein
LLTTEPGQNTKSRAKLRLAKARDFQDVDKKITTGSHRKMVASTTTTSEDQKQDEMEIIALSRLLESKQRTYATLGQSNATLSTVALQVTKEFDMQNPIWQQYIQGNALMQKQLEEIQELEAKLLDRTMSRKKAKVIHDTDGMKDDDDDGDAVFVYTTPRSSLSSSSNSTSVMKDSDE